MPNYDATTHEYSQFWAGKIVDPVYQETRDSAYAGTNKHINYRGHTILGERSAEAAYSVLHGAGVYTLEDDPFTEFIVERPFDLDVNLEAIADVHELDVTLLTIGDLKLKSLNADVINAQSLGVDVQRVYSYGELVWER